jgi:signal transduction histidine kinase
MAEEHAPLAARWFVRLRELMPVSDNEVFPTNSLLDHIPSLIIDISAHVRTPDAGPLAANPRVLEKARELGSLRHQQQASLHQVLREYQLLAQILMHFVEEESMSASASPTGAECVAVVMRIQQAVGFLLQETVETFVRLYSATIEEQNGRLEQFTRMAAHEWRGPLGALTTATMLLRMKNVDPSQQQTTLEVVERNVKRLIDVTVTLEKIARIDAQADNVMLQDVELSAVAREAARQLRDMADANNVDVRVSTDMPMLRVDVGRLELSLVNLLSNAIKYSDRAKPVRIVEVSARLHPDRECAITVADNGLGIPSDRLRDIFGRFTRAHHEHESARSVAGVGLGLSIVADCVREMGGRVEVDSTEGQGATFTIFLPANGDPSAGS